MKLRQIISLVAIMLFATAMMTCWLLGIWANDIRWGGTGVLMLVAGGLSALGLVE